jgi:DNA-binding SARP family transcriptional activator
VELRLLGPVEVAAAGRPLVVRGARQRGLLGLLLLLHANRVIAADRLADLLWAAAPSSKAARHRLQVQVSELRRVLADAGEAGRLVYRPPGYVLRVAPGELDLEAFQQLADQGRQLLAAGEAARASELLTEALELWRGRALEDVDLAGVRREAARLESRRLTVVEDRIEADLRCGRQAELLAELEEMVAAEPLRERLHAHLMLALYRSGRQADALATYRGLRERLVRELGIEPSPSLRELERRILAADPELQPAIHAAPRKGGPGAAAAVPAELPADVASFTGRQDELAQLERLLAASRPAGPVGICALHGAGGIGKSALAIHAAHRLAGHYPDGQLYVNLQGATPGLAPLEPLEVLGRFLRSLGTDPAQVPTGEQEAAARFRSLSRAGACWWCWTTPPARSRCGRYCPPPRAAVCW